MAMGAGLVATVAQICLQGFDALTNNGGKPSFSQQGKSITHTDSLEKRRLAKLIVEITLTNIDRVDEKSGISGPMGTVLFVIHTRVDCVLTQTTPIFFNLHRSHNPGKGLHLNPTSLRKYLVCLS